MAVPAAVLRGAVDASWRLRLQPTDPGWVDIAVRGPLLDTTRARTVLGWEPRVEARAALREMVDAIGRGDGLPTPVLQRRSWGPRRVLEAVRLMSPGPGAGSGSDLTSWRKK